MKIAQYEAVNRQWNYKAGELTWSERTNEMRRVDGYGEIRFFTTVWH